ncbi:hypothetical protein [Cellulomonas sp. NPDC089187]|uniref:hypothetical protein n=1 Tax=Cellulomonas sp. NPDC089187 TaxID=3154970 RepID=UPI0034362C76
MTPWPQLTGWPEGSPVPGRHLLLLPDGVAPDEVEVLAISRFSAARWERPPRVPSTRRETGAQATPGVLRLGRLSTVTGPFAANPALVSRLGASADLVTAWPVDVPRERVDTPALGGDRDGLRRAFGGQQPVREEGRVLRWLVDVARRLGGAIRTDTGVVLAPEMDAALDLTVFSDRWVEPDTVLAAARRIAPQAQADTPEVSPERLGTVAHTGRVLVERPDGGIGIDDPDERRRLHAEADAFDAWMVQNPPVAEGFGVLIDLGADGAVSVRAESEGDLPLVLHGLSWTAGEVVAYRVTWEPPELEELEAEHPSLVHRVARGRAAQVVRSIAREVQADVGGEVADMAGFLVDPAEL